MYTNPYDIARTYVDLLDAYSEVLNRVVTSYQSKRHLTVLTGMRKVVPANLYPVLEIEVQEASNEWATTHGQRPTYNFKFTLTIKCEKEELGLEYICTLTATLVRILTSPHNIQIPVLGAKRFSPDGQLVNSYIMDGLVDNVTYALSRDGTTRISEFNLWVKIHEPYPDIYFTRATPLECPSSSSSSE